MAPVQTARDPLGFPGAFFNPYFQVRLPSRYYDPALAPVVGRPIATCYEVTATGAHASGGACDQSTNDGQVLGMLFDDPASAFNGSGRFVDINSNQLNNRDGPDLWYTDAFGRHGQTAPFPGSMRQRLSKVDNQIGVSAGGPGHRREPQLLGRWGARPQLAGDG